MFELGEQAEKWAHAILHPKSTAEKLGIKPGLRISLVRMLGDSVMKDARKTAAAFAEDKPLRDSDMIFLAADAASELSGIKKLLSSLASKGALWIVYPKGKQGDHRIAGAERRTRRGSIRRQGCELFRNSYGAEVRPAERQAIAETTRPSRAETRWA